MLPDLIAASALVAQLTGRITTQPAPAVVTVQFDDTTVECPVRVDGSWSCELPQARLDLRIAADGRAPQYVWDADLTSGCLDLGDLPLATGASLSGWVRATRRGFDPRAVTVKLVPDIPASPDEGSTRLRSYTTRPNARGFFQFANVFPSTYAVVAEAEGVSSVRRGSIVVQEEREHTAGEPLLLGERARLELLVAPPAAPDGKPWRVQLSRYLPNSTYTAPLQQASVDEDGFWQSAPLDADVHALEIADRSGTVFHNELRIRVEPGMATLSVVISSLSVKGAVTTGGDPLRAALTFTTNDGEQVRLQSDDRGDFEGVFPKEGVWDVEIVPAGSRQNIRAGQVTIRRRDGAEHASLDLKLSGGRIRGKIVDEEGKPMKAAVFASRGRAPATETLSSDDGAFELLAIEPGTIAVFANARGAESQTVQVVVAKDEDPDPITLVVAPQREIAFVLSSASGYPVAGAQVTYRWGNVFTQTVYSNPSGGFQIRVPKGTQRVALAITAPGFPSKIANVAIAADARRVTLTISDTRAVLLYRGLDERVQPAWILHDGAAFLSSALRPRHFGGTREAGIALEPGTYSVCPQPHPTEQCIQRTMAAGASEVFDVTQWTKGSR